MHSLDNKTFERKMFVFILYQLLSETFFFQEGISEILLQMYMGVNITYPLLLRDFQETFFFDRFLKNTQMSNVIKISQVGFHSDRRTDGRTDERTDRQADRKAGGQA